MFPITGFQRTLFGVPAPTSQDPDSISWSCNPTTTSCSIIIRSSRSGRQIRTAKANLRAFWSCSRMAISSSTTAAKMLSGRPTPTESRKIEIDVHDKNCFDLSLKSILSPRAEGFKSLSFRISMSSMPNPTFQGYAFRIYTPIMWELKGLTDKKTDRQACVLIFSRFSFVFCIGPFIFD